MNSKYGDIVYKIRRKSDGLYMRKNLGKLDTLPDFTEEGSIWNTLDKAVEVIKSKSLYKDNEGEYSRQFVLDLEVVEFSFSKKYSTAYILDKF